MKLRRKLYASPQQQEDRPITSRDMQLEQGRLQRQLMQTQRMRQRLEAQEKRDEIRRITQLQRMEQQKDIEEDKQRIRVKRLEESEKGNNNPSLYKSKPHPVAPVSMK